MRKLIFLLLFTLSISSFVGCSKDDENTKEDYTWRGDWNDPNDPNFKPNGFNPIVGLWQSVSNPTLRFEYTEDFQELRSWGKDGQIFIVDSRYTYIINDTAFKSSFWGYSLFKVDNDKLYVHKLSNSFTLIGEWEEYRRVTK